MSSVDRLDVLRERNKDLLQQLKRQRERTLEPSRYSRKREREEEEEEEESVRSLIRTEGDRGRARAALRKTAVTSAGNGRFEFQPKSEFIQTAH